ncbi:hypothetical protein SO802_014391 [Lithocarpus litseifolius]|uniref:Myb/SANT-like domain-containing protein n=1 Tax=Lithocarpus litseifolius TaxID=425828 RepID=A0AAW2CUW6_9ROSI
MITNTKRSVELTAIFSVHAQDFPPSMTVAEVFNVLHQCSVLFRINELQLPTNQKPIKTDETRSILQTHYAEQTHPIPAVLPLLELTFSPLGTPLPPLWVSAFTVLEGKRIGGFLKKEGVDAMIKELGEMGKVVTHTQFKNKWDHLRKRWKDYNECFERETGLGRDLGTGQLDATDEWSTRKIAVNSLYIIVKNSTVYNYICVLTSGCPHVGMSHGRNH